MPRTDTDDKVNVNNYENFNITTSRRTLFVVIMYIKK